jgi:hypothetical protein
VDYADAFVVEAAAAQERSAEEWIRSVLDDAPTGLRRALRSGWHSLGLELGPDDSDGLVLGWEVRRSTGAHVLLGAGSRLGMPAELVLQRRPRSLLLATLIRQENPLVRAMWAGMVHVHRRVVPNVLARAAAG